jgi:cell division protein FtsL
MAKKVKRIRKQRFSITRTVRTLFIASAICFVASALFLRSYNVSLSVAQQKAEKKILEIQKENQTLASDIQVLSAYARVAAIAQQDGLSLIQDNIVTVNKAK